MKKIYIEPKTMIVKVELQQMIAESLGVYGTTDNNTMLSREGNSDWDDED